ncbi:hypothetical protein ACOMHN_007323 [Nucella lapillus]
MKLSTYRKKEKVWMMVISQPTGNAGAQQQAGAAPEDIWTLCIQQQYPHLLSQTYFHPHISSQVMFVISNLEFRKHLNNQTDPLHAAAIAQLPSIDYPSIPQNLRNSECDIVLIHRTYGLLIGEIKSVGGSVFFCSQTPDEQTQTMLKQIRNAVKQLDNQQTVLKHLVSDLPPFRIIMTLLLTNISSSQLQSALSDSPPLLEALCVTLTPHRRQPGCSPLYVSAAGPRPRKAPDLLADASHGRPRSIND